MISTMFSKIIFKVDYIVLVVENKFNSTLKYIVQYTDNYHNLSSDTSWLNNSNKWILYIAESHKLKEKKMDKKMKKIIVCVVCVVIIVLIIGISYVKNIRKSAMQYIKEEYVDNKQ